MHLATADAYTISPNPTSSTIITLAIYITALLAASLILCYFHQCSFTTPSPPCHTFLPLYLTNLSTHPHPTLSPSILISSQCHASMLSTSLLLLPPSSSSLLKDFLTSSKMSSAKPSSSFSTTLPSPRSSTSEHVQRIYLTCVACPFILPSPSCPEPFHHYLKELPGNILYPAEPSTRSFSPSPRLNSVSIKTKLGPANESLTPPSLFPWPFKSPCVLLLLHPQP